MFTRTAVKICLALAAVVVLNGCLSTTKVKKAVVVPPSEPKMANVQALGIAGVSGHKGNSYRGNNDNIRAKITSFLSGISAPGKPGFQLVDNEMMQNVIKHQRITEGSQFDGNTAIRIGKLTGADSLIFFNYYLSNLKTERYKSKYTDYDSCAKYKKNGKKCKEYRKRTETCTKAQITLELTPKVLDASTGALIFSNSYSTNVNSKKCPSRGQTLASTDEMVDKAFNKVFKDMRKDIYFYEVTMELELIESDDSDMPKKAEKHLANAIELVDENLISRACNQIQKAAAIYNESPAIMYNMGVCQEVQGDPAVAKGFFERALDYSSDLSGSDKDLVYSAIRRSEGK